MCWIKYLNKIYYRWWEGGVFLLRYLMVLVYMSYIYVRHICRVYMSYIYVEYILYVPINIGVITPIFMDNLK